MASASGIDPKATPVVLYDGGCGFCGWSVRRILGSDRAGRFRFAPLGTPIATELLTDRGLDPDPGSVVLIDGDRVRHRSEAVLGIARRLGGWWHLLRLGALLPLGWRDAAYGWVARYRGRLSRLFRTRPIGAGERAADPRFLA